MFGTIVVPLSAGICLFLFGMKVMENALQTLAGPYLRAALERFTRTPLRGMLGSTVLTALLQSSTAVTVITIGLVNAGLMRLPQTFGVILGANIGTCLTTELLGLSLQRYGLPLLLASAAAWTLASLAPAALAQRLRGARLAALAAAGFACILLGMDVMQTAVPALRAHGLFAWFVGRAQASPLWAVAAGAALTALVHSSAAAIAMAMGLAAAGTLPAELGIAAAIGANVGTCATALVAAVGSSRSGRRVAWAHLALNAGGALLFYPLLGALTAGMAQLTDSPAAQIAHAQTTFNVVCSLLALPLCYLPRLTRQDPPPAA